MKITLHIGTHKTGTTSLQRFLHSNRGQLKAQGVLYPDYGLLHHAHHEWPWSIAGVDGGRRLTDTSEQLLKRYLAEADAQRCDQLLVSSEEFEFVRAPAKLAGLAEQLKDFQVKILVYLRRQDYYLESEYGQHLRMYEKRETKEIDEFLFWHALADRFNYRRLLTPWAEAFGYDNIKVRVYEKERFAAGSIFTDFLSSLELTMSSQWRLPEENESNYGLSPLGMKAVKTFNRFPATRQAHQRLLKAIQRCEREGRSDANDMQRSAGLLTPDQRRGLLRYYGASNSYVAKTFLEGVDTLFDDAIPDQDPALTNPEQLQSFIARCAVSLASEGVMDLLK